MLADVVVAQRREGGLYQIGALPLPDLQFVAGEMARPQHHNLASLLKKRDPKKRQGEEGSSSQATAVVAISSPALAPATEVLVIEPSVPQEAKRRRRLVKASETEGVPASSAYAEPKRQGPFGFAPSEPADKGTDKGKGVEEEAVQFVARPLVADRPMTTQDSIFKNPIAAIGALQAIVTPVDHKELGKQGHLCRFCTCNFGG